jgi:ribonuclease VapC
VIIDTSAVIAVLRDESDASALAEAMQRSSICRLAAVSYVEAGVVTESNRDLVLSRRLDDLIRELRMRIEPVPPPGPDRTSNLPGFWQETA